MPADFSAERRLRPDVSKKSKAGLSSKEGEFATSTTTCAPVSASANPSPVSVFTPLEGDAATTSWPRWRRMFTAFDPMRPVPPIITFFIFFFYLCLLLEGLFSEELSDSGVGLIFDEREQLGIDNVSLGRNHAVRVVL